MIRRITLDGVDLYIGDVFYFDVRRGVVRSYVSERLPNGARKLAVVFDGGTLRPLEIERRGKIEYWFRKAA